MDPVAATNVLTAAAEALDRKSLVHQYIQHHVLYHVADGNPSVWNLPFIRIPALDVFRHDEVMLATGLVVLVVLFAGAGLFAALAWLPKLLRRKTHLADLSGADEPDEAAEGED